VFSRYSAACVITDQAAFLFLEPEMTSRKCPMSAIPPSTTPSPAQARFALGRVVAAPGALQLLDKHEVSVIDLLARHASGHDWGDLCPEDAHANDEALLHGGRLLSAYALKPDLADARIWVITEWDRSTTTILRPEEY